MTAMLTHRCSLLSVLLLSMVIGETFAFTGQPPKGAVSPLAKASSRSSKSNEDSSSGRASKVSPKKVDTTEKKTAAPNSNNYKAPAPVDWSAYAESLMKEQRNDEGSSFGDSSSFSYDFLSGYSATVSATSNGQTKSSTSETSRSNGAQASKSSSGSSYTSASLRNGDSPKSTSSSPTTGKTSPQASSDKDDSQAMSSNSLVEAASNIVATVTGLIKKGDTAEDAKGTNDKRSAVESQVSKNGTPKTPQSATSPPTPANFDLNEAGSNGSYKIGPDGLPYFFATVKNNGATGNQGSMDSVPNKNGAVQTPTSSAFDRPEDRMKERDDMMRMQSQSNGATRPAPPSSSSFTNERMMNPPAFVTEDSRSNGMTMPPTTSSSSPANRVARRIMHSSQYNMKAGFPEESNTLQSSQGATEKMPLGESRNMAAPQPYGPQGTLATKKTPPVLVHGLSLKTWAFQTPLVQSVLIVLNTEGRPLNTDVELWHGPDNTPQKIRVYVEDGSLRTFRTVMATPRGPNTVAIRNTGDMAFPLAAQVTPDLISAEPLSSKSGYTLSALKSSTNKSDAPQAIQGGALRLYPFDPNVESVQVFLQTDGRPLNARVELLQGPNNIKQVIDLYTEDGRDRPFYGIIDTPGTGNVIRVVNKSPVEFPLTAWVAPNVVVAKESPLEPVLGGDSDDQYIWGREL